MSRFILSLVLALFAGGAAADYAIERVEPASWWAGMENSRLQLLVHGERIAALEPAIDYPGVSIVRVIRTSNPNYLFLDLALGDDAAPGKFDIVFKERGRAVLEHAYVLAPRAPGSAARKGFGPEDVIYLAMPDRFANGDPANDRVPGYREGPARANPDGRHGGDLAGLRARLPYLAGMGFTQLWLNPVQQNDQPEFSYHGYAITDFYRIDDRLGDNALYRALAEDARAKGIGVIMDVILNHCGSGHWWMKDLPDPDWINHRGTFVGTTHRRETLHDPHAARGDRDAFTDGWFVPTMPDLNQRHPLLATYLIQNTIWWIEYAGLSGLRVDTLPYADREFLWRWYTRVREEYPALTIVGEEWSLDPAIVSRWQPLPKPGAAPQNAPATPSLMDFPLQNALVRGLTEPEGPETGLIRIYRSLADDFLYADPNRLVVFADNHDMSRIYTQLGERLDLYKLAMAFFATVRGTPQLTYGSEILMSNPGTEAHGVIRQDFPGGWAGDAADAASGRGLAPAQREAQAFLRRLLAWRKGATAIHRGALTQYAPQDGVYAYFRHDERQRVLVALNRAEEERRIDTARFAESIGGNPTARDVLTGRTFALESPLVLPPRSATILELSGAPAIPRGVTGTLKTHAAIASRHVDARRVDVWLPPGYDANAERRYPVVYFHDGQNLFDPAASYIGVDWGVDETMTRLIGAGAIREAIVVGIWNTPKRTAEYVPAKPLKEMSIPGDWPDMEWLGGERLVSDAYLRFLVEELKPIIDTSYRTLPGRDDTIVMGSSAGALISLYAWLEYPDVFGGAGCVSTHWPAGDGVMIDYLERRLPRPDGRRLYFDFGTATLDAAYEPYQRRADALLRAARYREGRDFISRKYEGAEHSERAWRARVEVPLVFLLGRPRRDQNR